ncbi:branched-chain amino acid aminotransferase [Cellulomonas alba]|uniref:branched-chain-amino-acid transaminase n=1 Tax=Cellulomonas alba TaxID=3053467 RepID=A0ABT7SK42_9CELL|nr:branched-chain amino acid aminotransferase [Cellulomonas alba]MDM7856558.1 branched-chain amino acid aminotransferase [Cellulomonas alba]
MTTTAPAAPVFPLRRSTSPASDEARAAALAEPGFGRYFTDHMARVSWDAERGWHDHRVEPYGPLTLDPATSVLHYGQEVFEGLKAYRHADGSVWAFRPRENARRLRESARRLALPELPESDFVAAVEALVRADAPWVPAGDEASLYVRPFLFASEPFVGVRASRRAELVVIASPAGPYFPRGLAPVSIWVSPDQHRAARGGTGAAKGGANYAASLAPQVDAAARGFDQVCYLDARTGSLLEEIGTMNVAVVRADGEVVTPPLGGTILAGVTRASLLRLLADAGHRVSERRLPLAEVVDGLRSGEVVEVLACGTAAVVTPVGRLAGDGFDLTVGDGSPGPLTAWARATLTDLQHGRAPDPYGWLHRLV